MSTLQSVGMFGIDRSGESEDKTPAQTENSVETQDAIGVKGIGTGKSQDKGIDTVKGPNRDFARAKLASETASKPQGGSESVGQS